MYLIFIKLICYYNTIFFLDISLWIFLVYIKNIIKWRQTYADYMK